MLFPLLIKLTNKLAYFILVRMIDKNNSKVQIVWDLTNILKLSIEILI